MQSHLGQFAVSTLRDFAAGGKLIGYMDVARI
jgi:hypothetical protein